MTHYDLLCPRGISTHKILLRFNVSRLFGITHRYTPSSCLESQIAKICTTSPCFHVSFVFFNILLFFIFSFQTLFMVFMARCPARQASKRSGLSAWSSCPVTCHPSQTPLTCAHVFKLFCRHHVRTHVKAASFCMCFQKQLRCLLWHFMLWPTNKTTAGNCEPPGRLERHRIPNPMDFYSIW